MAKTFVIIIPLRFMCTLGFGLTHVLECQVNDSFANLHILPSGSMRETSHHDDYANMTIALVSDFVFYEHACMASRLLPSG